MTGGYPSRPTGSTGLGGTLGLVGPADGTAEPGEPPAVPPSETAGRDLFLIANSADQLGGVTGWTHSLARLLAGRGHRVTVVGVAPAPPGRRTDLAPDLPYRVTTLHTAHPPGGTGGRGLQARLDPRRHIRRLARDAWLRTGAARLSALLRTARPGGVLIVAQVWAMEWVARADTAGLTVIGMCHESYEASRATSRYARVRRYFPDVDRLLLLTREDADRWAADGLTQVDALPNPLPFTPADPSPRTAKAVVSIGRLDDEKGIDLLLSAWATVAPRHPDWVLRIHGAGEPAQERELREQCAALGLGSSVDWAGTTDDVPGALRAASVLALPSRAEGFPLALLEAAAMGLPCVAFDCAPGVREIVRDGEDGLLAPPGNTRVFARHLDTLLSDPALRDRMGDTARTDAQRFAPARIVRRWEELFAFLER